ncbi:MAG TPA: ketopantoate reductase family protein [Polyangiaceae bacterium]|nr:ketopantoate reductase family protein [Polyangiaceae bacterium]
MTEPNGGPRILVVGCGAIGGVIGGRLAELDQNVSALTTNPRIAQALRQNGFCLSGEGEPANAKPRAVFESAEPGTEPFDFILLATQPPQVEEAASSVAHLLADGGRMVCFQNGLCEERVAKVVPPEQVIGAVVAWGASTMEPGVYDRTSAGGFSIGRLDGTVDAQLDDLARILEAIGPVTITQNLLGARFSKLAINCAISTLGTIGGDRLGVLLRHRHVRRLALEVMTEVVHVARAQRVRLEKVAGTIDLEWIALTESEAAASGSPNLVAKHGLLLAVGARYRRLRSSMLAAIERGRSPAVDFLNGEVVDRAERLGIPAPINARARELVWQIARGEVRASHATLRALYDRTR